jgi:hypothetical protein
MKGFKFLSINVTSGDILRKNEIKGGLKGQKRDNT